MNDITIHKVDELRCHLRCDRSIAMELADEFSFFVTGYKYMPLFKSGKWDGRIKLFNINTKEFYIGLIDRLKDFCDERGYTVGYHKESDFEPKIKYDGEFLSKWQDYGCMEPQPHQVFAVETALTKNKCLIKSPTGSGKSYICYLVVRYLLENTDGRILITVPSTSLVEQLYKDFEEYSDCLGFDVAENVHKIYSGKDKNTNHRVLISTWQSCYNLDSKWFKDITAYICDECHGSDGKSVSKIIDKLSHAPFRLGLTGTLDGTFLHELEMLARFGSIEVATTTRELMDIGALAPIKIDCLKFSYSDHHRRLVKHMSYDEEITFITTDEKRNLALVNCALRTKKNTLMLFNFIDKHGSILHKMLLEKAEKYGKKIFYISGKTKVTEREQIRKILETETNAILLASFGTLSTGVNIKNLHNLIFCHPYKAQIKTLQSIGRTIRKSAGKDGALLIDICDDICYNKKSGEQKQNTTYKHFIERLKIYENEGFPYKIFDVKLYEP